MATATANYLSHLSPPSGGVNSFAGSGMTYTFTLASVKAGSEVTIFLTDNATGTQTQIGYGNVTGTSPTFAFVFNNKTYVLVGATVYMSAIAQPEVWNDVNGIGNSYLSLGDSFGSPQSLVASSPYQGKLAFFSRYSTQIWIVDADPTRWALLQVLKNIGTVAPLSVQSLGDLDVLFLSDTGIRSLRARDNTLNAYVTDMGSPIDTLVTATNGSNETACAIVEPATNRYWCNIGGTIYVLSFFPANKILAWSTYLATFDTAMAASASTYPVGKTVTYTVVSGRKYYWTKGANEVSVTDGTTTLTASGYITAAGALLTVTGTLAAAAVSCTLTELTPFNPIKFATHNGRVYARDDSRFYLYGGSTNQTYDYSQGVCDTTWLDLSKPATRKKAQGLDAAFSGNFQFLVGLDYLNPTIVKQIVATQQVTFHRGGMPVQGECFHFKLQAKTLDNNPATLSSLIFHYHMAEEK